MRPPSDWASAQVSKTLRVEQLAPQPAVEALGIAVLPRASPARCTASPRPPDDSNWRIAWAMNSGPLSLRMCFGTPRITNRSRQHVEHILGRHAAIHLQRQALARVLVHDRQPLERTTVGRAIEHEVPGPNVVLVLGAAPNATACRYCPNAAFSAVFSALESPPDATDDRPVCDSPASLRAAAIATMNR